MKIRSLNRIIPDPPEEAGWYCVNFFNDLENSDPGFVLGPPEPVYYDPDEDEMTVCYDPLGPAHGGIQVIEQIAIWGQRIHGMERKP